MNSLIAHKAPVPALIELETSHIVPMTIHIEVVTYYTETIMPPIEDATVHT